MRYQVNLYELTDLPNGDQEEQLVRTVSQHDEWSDALDAYDELQEEHNVEEEVYAVILDTNDNRQYIL